MDSAIKLQTFTAVDDTIAVDAAMSVADPSIMPRVRIRVRVGVRV